MRLAGKIVWTVGRKPQNQVSEVPRTQKKPARRCCRRGALVLAAGLMAGTMVPAQAFADGPHLVEPGEHLTGIAREHGIPVAEIVAANALINPDVIYVGAVLQIPPVQAPASAPSASESYKVRLGDSLSSIAADYGISESALTGTNKVSNGETLLIGQTLQIPSEGRAGAVRSRQSSTQVLAERKRVAAALEKAAKEFNVDLRLLQSLAYQESGWQQRVVSSTGAVGILQLMPGTATWALEMFFRKRPLDWRTSEADNARVGTAFLAHLLKLSDGDVEVALASYYQGWAGVQRDGMLAETRAYVNNILALTQMNTWPDFGPAPWVKAP